MLYLFRHYCDIKTDAALTFGEIESWQNLIGTRLSPCEVEILRTFDTVFYEVRNEAKE